jgi:WD40 repeat protein
VRTANPARKYIEYPDAPHCLAFDSGGRALAAAGWDRSLWVWDTAWPPTWRRLGEHGDGVFVLALSNDGNHLATGDFKGVLTLWGWGQRPVEDLQ